MWRYALLGPLLVAGANADVQDQRVNSSAISLSSSAIPRSTSQSIPQSKSQTSSSASRSSLSLPVSVITSSSTSSLKYQVGSLSTHSSTSQSASLSSSRGTYSATRLPTTSTTSVASSKTASRSNSTSVISGSSKSSNSSALPTGLCTGCVLQAFNPITTYYKKDDEDNPWTSVVVTETIVTQFITYFDGSTIDTVVTEAKTVNQTKTVVHGSMNETITHSTPYITVEATPGLYLTLMAGPTYVFFNALTGGLDERIGTKSGGACAPTPTPLKNWEPAKTEDWNNFIQTYSGPAPRRILNWPVSLPPQLIDFLKQDPDIKLQYHGSDMATCTVHSPGPMFTGPTGDPSPNSPARTTIAPSSPPVSNKPHISPQFPEMPHEPQETITKITKTAPAQTEAPITVPFESRVTGTFLSTTYESTSTHVTRQGCLRCGNTTPENGAVPTDPPLSDKAHEDSAPTYKPDDVTKPKPDDPSKPTDDATKPPGLPDIIASIINNNPSLWPQPTPGPMADKSITIGDTVLPVNTAKPQTDPSRPSEQNQVPPYIVIGSETLTPGQTKTINGVPVVVPTGGGGTQLVVGGSTIVINTAPTSAPILTVGTTTITANPQGQFVLGKETLKPGGPAVTYDGTTLSLGPSGTVAVVNGITQTLANAAATAAPALTVDNQVISGTVVGGSTLFVFGPSLTLTPGGVLTVSGTIFSLPASASGSVVVVNGVTSTIANPNSSITKAPLLTINGNTYAATVRSGTTEYVLAAGTTLRPGEIITVSGTTYSLDPKGTALVINGRTSSIVTAPASNSASTTGSSAGVSASSSARRSLTSGRDAGNFIASGIGEISRAGGAQVRGGGFDGWIEGVLVGVAGWVVMLV